MTDTISIRWRASLASITLLLLTSFVLGGCDEGNLTGPPIQTGAELAVVMNSVDRTLSIFPVNSLGEIFTLGFALDGSPATVAARGSLVAVPLGSLPAVAIVDVARREVTRTVPLPAGSGATGVAFVNDSIILVANPNLDSVTPVNALRGTTTPSISVGGFPQAIVVAGDRVLVLNAELGADFLPARNGTITVLDRESLGVVGTIDLSGTNPGSGTEGPGGAIFIVNSGSFGEGNGSLSEVSPTALSETDHHPGFGDFPGAAAFGPDGQLYVTSFSYGLAIWDPGRDSFTRSPDDAFEPGGVASASGVGFDLAGRLYTLKPDCTALSSVFRFDIGLMLDAEIPVGLCPFGITFTRVGGTG
jgi:hypothetical protein